MSKLDEMYFAVESYLSKIDFDKLWKDFKPLKFALYNNLENNIVFLPNALNQRLYCSAYDFCYAWVESLW